MVTKHSQHPEKWQDAAKNSKTRWIITEYPRLKSERNRFDKLKSLTKAIRKFLQKKLSDLPRKNNTDTVIGQYVSSKKYRATVNYCWLLMMKYNINRFSRNLWTNHSIINKKQRYQTQFFPEKNESYYLN